MKNSDIVEVLTNKPGRMTLRKVAPVDMVVDSGLVEDVNLVEEMAMQTIAEPNLDFVLSGQVGDVVTEEWLLDLLNNAKPGSMPSFPVSEPSSTIRRKSTLTNYRAVLKSHGISQTGLQILFKIATKNPDVASFTNTSAQTDGQAFKEKIEPISPILASKIRDKKLLKLLKSIGIYNLVQIKQDKEEWSYLFQTPGGKLETVTIERLKYARYVTLEEGFGMAVATFLLNRNAEPERQRAMSLDELTYPRHEA